MTARKSEGWALREPRMSSSFCTKYFVQKELDIRGSRNALPEDFDGVIRYLKKYNPPYEVLTSGVVNPEEAQQAMEKWDAEPGKVFRILVKFAS